MYFGMLSSTYYLHQDGQVNHKALEIHCDNDDDDEMQVESTKHVFSQCHKRVRKPHTRNTGHPYYGSLTDVVSRSDSSVLNGRRKSKSGIVKDVEENGHGPFFGSQQLPERTEDNHMKSSVQIALHSGLNPRSSEYEVLELHYQENALYCME